jgi:hypothetical protein
MSFSDWLNPVTLKELRQMVRSRMVAAGLIGFLAISQIATGLVLLNSQEELQHGMQISEKGLGDGVFSTIYIILALLLLLAAPYFFGARMGAERSSEHLDLQYTTILKPRQLVDGKVVSAAILLLLFVSATLPFLSLAYLLRGLDVLQALLATVMLMFVAVACVFVALFLATAAPSRSLRVLVVLGMLWFQGMVLSLAIGGGMMMVNYQGLSLSSWSDWAVPGLFLAAWLSTCLLLRAATISLIMPAVANRAPAVRGWITVLWAFWGMVAALFAWHETEIAPVMVWAFLSLLAFAVFGAISASGAPGYSRRVLAGVSPSGGRRTLQFLFFSGAENGMCWALVMSLLTLLAASLVEAGCPDSWKPRGNDPDTMSLFILCCYLTTYIWGVRGLWRGLLHRWFTYRLTGVVAVIVMLLVWAIPQIMALGSPDKRVVWVFGNPFIGFNKKMDLIPIATTAAICAAVAVAANLKWLVAAIRDFIPPAPATQKRGD